MTFEAFQTSAVYDSGSIPLPRCCGRLDAIKTARMLGFEAHDIPVLVQQGHLEPLGKPHQNAKKYFAAIDVIRLAHDRAWLNKATHTVYRHWQTKNAKRTKNNCELAIAA